MGTLQALVGEANDAASSSGSLVARIKALEEALADLTPPTLVDFDAEPILVDVANVFGTTAGSTSVLNSFVEGFQTQIAGFKPETVELSITGTLTVAQAVTLAQAGLAVNTANVTYSIRDAYTTIQSALTNPQANAALAGATEVVAFGNNNPNPIDMMAFGPSINLRIEALGGDDTIYSGPGNHTIVGGLGGDTIWLTDDENAADTVVYQTIMDGRTLPMSTITFSDDPDDYREGSVLTITINGTSHAYTTGAGGETPADAVAALVDVVTADSAVISDARLIRHPDGSLEVRVLGIAGQRLTVEAGGAGVDAIENDGQTRQWEVTFPETAAAWPTQTNPGKITQFDRELALTIEADGQVYTVIANIVFDAQGDADIAASIRQLVASIEDRIERSKGTDGSLNGILGSVGPHFFEVTLGGRKFVLELASAPERLPGNSSLAGDPVTIVAFTVDGVAQTIGGGASPRVIVKNGEIVQYSVSSTEGYFLNAFVSTGGDLTQFRFPGEVSNTNLANFVELAPVATPILLTAAAFGPNSFDVTGATIEQNGVQHEAEVRFSTNPADYFQGGALSLEIAGEEPIVADMVEGDPIASVQALVQAVNEANRDAVEDAVFTIERSFVPGIPQTLVFDIRLGGQDLRYEFKYDPAKASPTSISGTTRYTLDLAQASLTINGVNVPVQPATTFPPGFASGSLHVKDGEIVGLRAPLRGDPIATGYDVTVSTVGLFTSNSIWVNKVTYQLNDANVRAAFLDSGRDELPLTKVGLVVTAATEALDPLDAEGKLDFPGEVQQATISLDGGAQYAFFTDGTDLQDLGATERGAEVYFSGGRAFVRINGRTIDVPMGNSAAETAAALTDEINAEIAGKPALLVFGDGLSTGNTVFNVPRFNLTVNGEAVTVDTSGVTTLGALLERIEAAEEIASARIVSGSIELVSAATGSGTNIRLDIELSAQGIATNGVFDSSFNYGGSGARSTNGSNGKLSGLVGAAQADGANLTLTAPQPGKKYFTLEDVRLDYQGVQQISTIQLETAASYSDVLGLSTGGRFADVHGVPDGKVFVVITPRVFDSGLGEFIDATPVVVEASIGVDGEQTAANLVAAINAKAQSGESLFGAIAINGATHAADGSITITAAGTAAETFVVSDVRMDYAGVTQQASVRLSEDGTYTVGSQGDTFDATGRVRPDVYFEGGKVWLEITPLDAHGVALSPVLVEAVMSNGGSGAYNKADTLDALITAINAQTGHGGALEGVIALNGATADGPDGILLEAAKPGELTFRVSDVRLDYQGIQQIAQADFGDFSPFADGAVSLTITGSGGSARTETFTAPDVAALVAAIEAEIGGVSIPPQLATVSIGSGLEAEVTLAKGVMDDFGIGNFVLRVFWEVGENRFEVTISAEGENIVDGARIAIVSPAGTVTQPVPTDTPIEFSEIISLFNGLANVPATLELKEGSLVLTADDLSVASVGLAVTVDDLGNVGVFTAIASEAPPFAIGKATEGSEPGRLDGLISSVSNDGNVITLVSADTVRQQFEISSASASVPGEPITSVPAVRTNPADDPGFFGDAPQTGAVGKGAFIGSGVRQSFANPADSFLATAGSAGEGSTGAGDSSLYGDDPINGVIAGDVFDGQGVRQSFLNPGVSYDASPGSPVENASGARTGDDSYFGDPERSGADGVRQTFADAQGGYDAIASSPEANPHGATSGDASLLGSDPGVFTDDGLTTTFLNGVTVPGSAQDGDQTLYTVDRDGRDLTALIGSSTVTNGDDPGSYDLSSSDINTIREGIEPFTWGDGPGEAVVTVLSLSNPAADVIHNFQVENDTIALEADLAASTLDGGVDATVASSVTTALFDLSTTEFGLVESKQTGLSVGELSDAEKVSELLASVFDFSVTGANSALNTTIFAITASDDDSVTAIWAHQQSSVDDDTVDAGELFKLATVNTIDGAFGLDNFDILHPVGVS